MNLINLALAGLIAAGLIALNMTITTAETVADADLNKLGEALRAQPGPQAIRPYAGNPLKPNRGHADPAPNWQPDNSDPTATLCSAQTLAEAAQKAPDLPFYAETEQVLADGRLQIRLPESDRSRTVKLWGIEYEQTGRYGAAIAAEQIEKWTADNGGEVFIYPLETDTAGNIVAVVATGRERQAFQALLTKKGWTYPDQYQRNNPRNICLNAWHSRAQELQIGNHRGQPQPQIARKSLMCRLSKGNPFCRS